MALHSLLLVTSAAALLAPPTQPTRSTQLKAVWSNANAIKDYHNMLSGVVNERLDDGPGVVLGLKGDAFADAYAKLAPGTPDLRINFGDAPPETIKGSDEKTDLEEYPIYVICMSPCLLYTSPSPRD